MVVVKYSSERCIHREFVDYGIKFQIIRKFRAFLYIRESLLGMLRLLAWNIVLNNLGNFCLYKSNWHYVYYIIILNIYIYIYIYIYINVCIVCVYICIYIILYIFYIYMCNICIHIIYYLYYIYICIYVCVSSLRLHHNHEKLKYFQ